jgi:O-acetylhomoserine/O-acetylserine sulfhydrylase-like pyridoxal-dependent enzyme
MGLIYSRLHNLNLEIFEEHVALWEGMKSVGGVALANDNSQLTALAHHRALLGKITDALVRLSIGIEYPADLI